MSKINRTRKGCKDVFNSFLVSNAYYNGVYEFPVISSCTEIPQKIIPFSHCISFKDHNCWVHFYEDDYLFERLWRNPKKYLPILQQYNGVILPDWSLYRDMPFVMQLWNIYRSRAIGAYFQTNGIKVIPNVRFGDRRTYHCCCDGLPQQSVIAVGTHGTLKNLSDKEIFIEGLEAIVEELKPTAIIVYGSCPDSLFRKYKDMGITIHHFESEFGKAMKKHKEVI
ncbi:MAG: DUF4417 domain-containing protein [Clostridiales bacterium]|nr:DUF4417 domain-containing protein [Clostridiales bacterium]